MCVFLRSCFVDDEPPCVEEIEYHSHVTSDPSCDDLDSEVNANMSNTEEDEKDKDKDGDKQKSQHRGNHSADLKPRLYPHLCRPDSLESL